MKIYPLNSGYFKLDGGAMHGVVPKSLWSRKNEPDEKNLCSWAMRLMLIEDDDRLTLVDTGIGDKQDEKFFSFYYLHGDDSIDKGLKALGFSRDDITDVFLTHLHFDHVGGAIQRNEDETGYEPAFKNARFWTNKRHWDWALNPNPREKASFLKENLLPMEESGKLNFINTGDEDGIYATPLGFDILLVSGHTDAQMLPIIEYQDKTMVYMADLLPSAAHVPLPWVMAYDVRPLITMDEKAKFLQKAADEGYYLFLEHDAKNELCTVQNTEKGVRLKETHAFHEIFGK